MRDEARGREDRTPERKDRGLNRGRFLVGQGVGDGYNGGWKDGALREIEEGGNR